MGQSLLTVLLLLAVLLASAATARAQNPIDSLAARTWYERLDSRMRTAAPCGGTRGGVCGRKVSEPMQNCYSSYDAEGDIEEMFNYSGGAYDHTRGWLIAWGGGHVGWMGNDVYAYNVNAHAWMRLRDASCLAPNEGRRPGSHTHWAADGAPRTRHTYGSLQYVPAIDRFCAFGATSFTTNSSSAGTVDCFDLTARTWEPKSSIPGGQPGYGQFTALDYVTGRVWLWGGSSKPFVYSWNPVTDAWTPEGNTSPTCCSWNTAAIRNVTATRPTDPDRHLAVACGNGVCYKWDLSHRPPVRTTMSLSGDVAAITGYTQLEYDRVADRFVTWKGGPNIFSLEVSTGVWSTITPDPRNNVTPPAVGANGTYGRFRYMPERNLFILVNSVDQNVLFYRYQAATDPRPRRATPPGRPTERERHVAGSRSASRTRE